MLVLALFTAVALQATAIAPVTVPLLAPPPRILVVCLYDDPEHGIIRSQDMASAPQTAAPHGVATRAALRGGSTDPFHVDVFANSL